MLIAILNCCTAEELEESSEEDEAYIEAVSRGLSESDAVAAKRARQEAIKAKILAMGRMTKVFELLRCGRVFVLLLG